MRSKLSHIKAHFRLIWIGLALFNWLLVSSAPFYAQASLRSLSLQQASDNEQITAGDEAQDEDSSPEDQDKKAQINVLSLENAVHAPSVHLQKSIVLLSSFVFPQAEETTYYEEEARPLISYLEKTFCRLIAINAP